MRPVPTWSEGSGRGVGRAGARPGSSTDSPPGGAAAALPSVWASVSPAVEREGRPCRLALGLRFADSENSGQSFTVDFTCNYFFAGSHFLE